MRIDHIAIWAHDLEAMKGFYCTWFQAQAGPKYVNESRGFESYFLTFPSGARLEIMRCGAGEGSGQSKGEVPSGFAHIAFSVGSKLMVDTLTERLREAGHTVMDGPRLTGDGYYESTILDPEGNRIEITG